MSVFSVRRALSGYIKHAKAYGHPKKGVGKRNASKARRRVGKALAAEG